MTTPTLTFSHRDDQPFVPLKVKVANSLKTLLAKMRKEEEEKKEEEKEKKEDASQEEEGEKGMGQATSSKSGHNNFIMI